MKGYSKLMLKHAETLEKESYHQMDHIFSISTYVRDNLISHYEVDPKKITVVGTGLGIIEPYFGPKNYNNGKIIFVAKGRFSDKGGPLVLEAFKLAQMVNPSLELCIVGQSEYEGIEDISNLKTYGFISIDALQQLFNEASLFLMPATNEPWGLVYLEALACKIPIVGLNMNGFPEISRNGEYGYILNDYSPSALSQVILDAFSSPKNLESMGLNGQNYCLKNFSWDHTASKIINVINSY
jgi:glycosyltransferase involved in cell wall biosynthesis